MVIIYYSQKNVYKPSWFSHQNRYPDPALDPSFRVPGSGVQGLGVENCVLSAAVYVRNLFLNIIVVRAGGIVKLGSLYPPQD